MTSERAPERFEDEAQVVAVVEMAVQAQAVELVFGILIVQLLDAFQLFQTNLVPENNLNNKFMNKTQQLHDTDTIF